VRDHRTGGEAGWTLARPTLATAMFWTLVALVVIQLGHMNEHAVQLMQWLAGVAEPSGIFGALFDAVWVHLVYNALVFAALAVVYLSWRRTETMWRLSTRGALAFRALLVAQSYHVLETLAQAIQFYGFGVASPPGLIGVVAHPIPAHFAINLVVTTLLLSVAFSFRPRPQPYDAPEGPRAGGGRVWGITRPALAKGVSWVVAAVVVIQLGHLNEQTVQLVQWLAGTGAAVGILGALFDVVWVHLVYSSLVFAALAVVYLSWRRTETMWRLSTRGALAFRALLVAQSYHVLETLAQAIQFYGFGVASPPGLIGVVAHPIPAHFAINLVVTSLLLSVAYDLRPWPRGDQTASVGMPG
jgi:hypothetical protein